MLFCHGTNPHGDKKNAIFSCSAVVSFFVVLNKLSALGYLFAAVTADASPTSCFFYGFCLETLGYTSNMPVDVLGAPKCDPSASTLTQHQSD